MTDLKPYSSACDENKEPILDIIKEIFINSDNILEIGSGTGQHAVYFGHHLPELNWHTSDLPENHKGILAWLKDTNLPNVESPLELDVSNTDWNKLGKFDGIFSANAVHIMHWDNVIDMFSGIGEVLLPGGKCCLYGPFNYNGEFSSQSNANFDSWLKNRDPGSGIRDFEALDNLASGIGMQLIADYSLPVNNKILFWEKKR